VELARLESDLTGRERRKFVSALAQVNASTNCSRDRARRGSGGIRMSARLVLEELAAARKSLDKATAFILQFQIGRKTLTEQDKTVPARVQRPSIPVVTENGFTIVRLCELDESIRDSPNECHFLVVTPKGDECSIKVVFSEAALTLLQSQPEASVHLPTKRRFWLRCSERHLATYLWETDCCPSSKCLLVDSLTPEDLLLARRCE